MLKMGPHPQVHQSIYQLIYLILLYILLSYAPPQLFLLFAYACLVAQLLLLYPSTRKPPSPHISVIMAATSSGELFGLFCSTSRGVRPFASYR